MVSQGQILLVLWSHLESVIMFQARRSLQPKIPLSAPCEKFMLHLMATVVLQD